MTYEVSAAALRPCVDFYLALGFYEVAVPPGMGADGAILAHESGQGIHLLVQEKPALMRWGHVALVPGDYRAAIERLEALGHEVDHRRPYWGAARCFVLDPQGNRVELLESPPRFTPRRADGRPSELLQEGGSTPSQ